MLIPIPDRVDDPKDAVLWSMLDKLQKIDENEGSRINFATTIAYNSHVGINSPVFEFELEQLRNILNVKKPEPDPVQKTENVREFDEVTSEQTMRDDL